MTLRLPQLVAASLVVAVAVPASPAHAGEPEGRADRMRRVLRELFPSAERVAFVPIAADHPGWARVERAAGPSNDLPPPTFFEATAGGATVGFAAIGVAVGRSVPFEFALGLSVDGVVERARITHYRSPGGRQVLEERFQKQFIGKSARDALRTGHDVDVVSGATVSARSMIHQVRRPLAAFEELVRPKRRQP